MSFRRQKQNYQTKALSVMVRKHLNAHAFIRTVRNSFEQVGKTRTRETSNPHEKCAEAAFAMFSLKDCALLRFDKRRVKQPTNLKTIYASNR